MNVRVLTAFFSLEDFEDICACAEHPARCKTQMSTLPVHKLLLMSFKKVQLQG